MCVCVYVCLHVGISRMGFLVVGVRNDSDDLLTNGSIEYYVELSVAARQWREDEEKNNQ